MTSRAGAIREARVQIRRERYQALDDKAAGLLAASDEDIVHAAVTLALARLGEDPGDADAYRLVEEAVRS